MVPLEHGPAGPPAPTAGPPGWQHDPTGALRGTNKDSIMTADRRKTTLILDGDLKDAVDLVAQVRGESLNGMVVRLLTEELDRVRGDKDFQAELEQRLSHLRRGG